MAAQPRTSQHAHPLALAIAGLCAGLVLVGALVAGHGQLQRSAEASARLARAAGLLDAAAHAAAGQQGDPAARETALQAIDRPNAPLIAPVVVVASGGVDDFGIDRGTDVVRGADGLTPDVKTALLGAVKRTMTAAEDATRKHQPLAGAEMRTILPGPQQALILPYRPKPGATDFAGAVVLRLQPPTEPPTSPLVWLLPLLVAVLAVVLVRPLGPRVGPTLSLLTAALAGVLLLPPLPDAGVAGIQVLADAWTLPHAALVEPLPPGGVWLASGALLLAALLGPTLAGLAHVLVALRRDPVPYAYVGPAVLATGVLVFVPFAVGVGLSFAGGDGQFLGLANYAEVVRTALDPNSATHFARTLAMTVAWTLINVLLHVSIGLALAIVLNQPKLRGRALYRLLLIVPWAVPSYITALTWKWLFNTQYGPINAMLALCGAQKVDWLGDSLLTNFAANLATNVWLGFPFMMVVSLGALQSIPADLYEAADIDGATGWQKFRHVTWPLLRPALFPAIIMGIIWTFNSFNVIYLVSGGGPDHKTDILITEAYYAFSVLRRHGLAAAYSVLIFALLLLYTLVTQRRSKATEAVNA